MATKPTPTGSRKITGTGTSRKVENKTLKPGSMVTQTKIVDVKPKKKTTASTKYSPAPMSDAAKRKASRAGEAKAYQYVDIMKRPEKKGPARTSYSPQRMTEYDKAKAAARGKATAAKTKPSIAKKVAGAAGMAATAAAGGAGKIAGTLAKVVMKQKRPTKQLMNNGKVFTPEQKAYLKKMLSQGGRLDK
jgi:hypothetical protein